MTTIDLLPHILWSPSDQLLQAFVGPVTSDIVLVFFRTGLKA
jgi:hypothetical protein